MARIQMKTVLLAVLAMACTRSAYGTVELIDAALQAKASELESLKGQGSGTTSTTATANRCGLSCVLAAMHNGGIAGASSCHAL